MHQVMTGAVVPSSNVLHQATMTWKKKGKLGRKKKKSGKTEIILIIKLSILIPYNSKY